jgi:hypothetical protein
MVEQKLRLQLLRITKEIGVILEAKLLGLFSCEMYTIPVSQRVVKLYIT